MCYPHAPGLHAYGDFASDAAQAKYGEGFPIELIAAVEFPVPTSFLHALAGWHDGTRQSAN